MSKQLLELNQMLVSSIWFYSWLAYTFYVFACHINHTILQCLKFSEEMYNPPNQKVLTL